MVFIMLVACAEKGRDELVIGCVGDSLMRPIPLHLKRLMRSLERKIVIKEWAQGGTTARSYLDSFRRRFHNMREARPDFILIQLGTNDVQRLIAGDYTLDEFRANMKGIIDEFKTYSGGRGGPTLILIANAPPFYNEKHKRMNPFVQEVLNPNIEIFAKDEQLYLVDNYRMLNNRPHLYSPDGVHPNDIGERTLAQNWIIAIKKVSRISTSRKQ